MFSCWNPLEPDALKSDWSRAHKETRNWRTQWKWYFKIVERQAAALSGWSHNWSPWRLNFNEVLDLTDPSCSRFIDGTEKVSNFSSFWMAMEPSQLQWLKKVFCFPFMEKVGFRKVSERFFGGILFCRFDSWPFLFPAFVFFYSSYVQTTRLNPKPVLWRKKYQKTFKLQCMLISKLFYNLIGSLRSKAKIRISHTKSYKILEMSLLILPRTLRLGCLWFKFSLTRIRGCLGWVVGGSCQLAVLGK